MRRNNMTNFFAAGIDVTNKCTLRCLHCFNSSGGLKNQRMDEMSDEELERMAYDVIDCRPVSICMCGGEPLHYKIFHKNNLLLQYLSLLLLQYCVY